MKTVFQIVEEAGGDLGDLENEIVRVDRAWNAVITEKVYDDESNEVFISRLNALEGALTDAIGVVQAMRKLAQTNWPS